MKKTLITSTAMVLLAGAAAAQVSFSGYGRFGLGYNENRVSEDIALVSRFRLNIDGKAVTDGGVEFSARVRLQADDTPAINEQNAATLNGARFSVIYGGLRVDAGNVAGQFDNMVNYYGFEPGLEAFTGQYVGVDYSFLGYSSTGAGSNAVYVNYAAGGFSFGASYDPNVAANNDRWDVGAAYTWNNFTGAVTYGENENDQSLVIVTLGADFDRFSGTVLIGDEDLGAGATNDGTVYGLSLSFDVGAATSIQASYGSGEGDSDTEGYGISFVHDLGGGVSLKGGIGQQAAKNASDNVIGDLGVVFNF
ncbi:porin [Marinibacterium sp. SX1]|uniref:porin n=1 Tax=Marinibacterium sp. SX1 TaxID=3388424 RepID=UPI003D17E56B